MCILKPPGEIDAFEVLTAASLADFSMGLVGVLMRNEVSQSFLPAHRRLPIGPHSPESTQRLCT